MTHLEGSVDRAEAWLQAHAEPAHAKASAIVQRTRASAVDHEHNHDHDKLR